MASSVPRNSRKLLGWGIIVLCAVLLSSVLVYTNIAGDFEARLWDLRLRVVANPAAVDPNVKIIVIDQRSLDFEANDPSRGIYWPWPRQMYVPVIEYLRKAGAKGVAFDILFTEQSSYGVEDDHALASAVTGSMPVVFATALDRAAVQENPSDIELFLERLKQRGPPAMLNKQDYVTQEFKAATLPVPEILATAQAFGNVTAEPDSDGIFRRSTIFGSWTGGGAVAVPVLNLPFALLDVIKELPKQDLAKLGANSGELVIGYHGPGQTYPTYPMSQIIQSFVAISEGTAPQVPPTLFKDAVVFVGMTAPGLLDLRPSPLDRRFPGVEVNATVFDNARNGHFVTRTTAETDIAVAVISAMFAAFLCLYCSQVWLQVVGVTAWSALLAVGSIFLAAAGFWVGLVPVVFSVTFSVLGALVVQYQLEGRQHRFIRNAFRHYVSSAVIDKIVADPAALSLGGDKRELTIFFSDIAGFTSISEKLGPADLMALLNRYLTEMTDIIMQHNGTVDKYVGDAIVAFWNAPLQIPDHAAQAMLAALSCQRRLAELRREFQQQFGIELRSRIGLHTGVVNVGNFGSRERFNYTVVGDAANLASRLEGANKYFGSEILVSAETAAQAGGAVMSRKIADIKVVGKDTVVAVYEPLAPVGERSLSPEEQSFEAARTAYVAGRLTEAADLFQTLPLDPVAKSYLNRVNRDLTLGGSKGSWDAVWQLTEK